MTLHIRNGIKIRTSFVYPPIPDRSMDWSAIDSDTYDCDCDQDGFFSTDPIGRGATEEEAIADLLEQIADRETYAEANRGDDEPDNDRNLGLLNPITASRRVGY